VLLSVTVQSLTAYALQPHNLLKARP